MIIIGPANMAVMTTKKNRITGLMKRVCVFRFDANGRYETDDPKIIAKARRKFKVMEDPSPESHVEAVVDIEREPAEPDSTGTYRCKQCDFVADNWGVLMAHYRAEHKKSNG